MKAKGYLVRTLPMILIGILLSSSIVGCGPKGHWTWEPRYSRANTVANKNSAILPIKEQGGIVPASFMDLRKEISKHLTDKLQEKIPGGKIIESNRAVDMLNDANKISVLDDLIKVYDNTGVVDKRHIRSLCDSLNCDYLVFTRLRIEKASVVVSGLAVTVDALVLGRREEVMVGSGSCNWSRFSLVNPNMAVIADKLLTCALSGM